MSDSAIIPVTGYSTDKISGYRRRLQHIREQLDKRFDQGATGIQIAATAAEKMDELIIDIFEAVLATLEEPTREKFRRDSALVAVGGSGRRELSPYSDADLLFLSRGATSTVFDEVVSQAVRDCWDSGIQLGHSVRSLGETIRLAKSDIQIATTLVEARRLWGSDSLVERLIRQFRRRVIGTRPRAFAEWCVQARAKERQENGDAVLQLEPDVKRSYGGLRDAHLIRWIGYAFHDVTDIDSLRLKGALTNDEARHLRTAVDFITLVRVDLHFHAGKAQDVLTRDDQLRITEIRGIEDTPAQRGVERFMQEYFRHSMNIAEISERFAARHLGPSLSERLLGLLMTHRVDDIYFVGPHSISVARRHRARLCRRLEPILDLYLTASRHGVMPTPELAENITNAVPELSRNISTEAALKFLTLLREAHNLGPILRSMYRTGVLEIVLPEMTHARCLLQFNQYHSYTVDEHTLRAVEAAASFRDDPGPLGEAYREIPDRHLLFLAILYHDFGKGYEEDHSEVGRRLAATAAERLFLPETMKEELMLLVRRHLLMATLAFRRDISDADVLSRFASDVGSTDVLRMLYVLSASDLTAVGPGVFTEWKAELLANLYHRTKEILNGRHYLFQPENRERQVTERVLIAAQDRNQTELEPLDPDWIHTTLATLPTNYLTSTQPQQVVTDLWQIHVLDREGVQVSSRYQAETGTVEYRVITREALVTGCFSRICGVLTAQRMEILAAQICTSSEGVIIDAFRVLDHDYDGTVPAVRREEVSTAIQRVLLKKQEVEDMLRSRRRSITNGLVGPVSDLPTRVAIDNTSSDRYTIVDVFAHDRPGLLYQIAHTLWRLGLSVSLAKISTHFDQVVDVFYVTESDHTKITDPARLEEIRLEVTREIETLVAALATAG